MWSMTVMKPVTWCEANTFYCVLTALLVCGWGLHWQRYQPPPPHPHRPGLPDRIPLRHTPTRAPGPRQLRLHRSKCMVYLERLLVWFISEWFVTVLCKTCGNTVDTDQHWLDISGTTYVALKQHSILYITASGSHCAFLFPPYAVEASSSVAGQLQFSSLSSASYLSCTNTTVVI